MTNGAESLISFKNMMIALQGIDYNERSGIVSERDLRTVEAMAWAYLATLGWTPEAEEPKMTDRYNAIISQLPIAAKPYPALRLSAEVHAVGHGLDVLELRPRGGTTYPVLWYDDCFNDTPQVGIYDTPDDWGNVRDMHQMPDRLDGAATAQILCSLADFALRHSPYNTPAF